MLARAKHTGPVLTSLRHVRAGAALPPKLAGAIRTYAAEAGGKFVRSKPHMNIGTIGHVGMYL